MNAQAGRYEEKEVNSEPLEVLIELLSTAGSAEATVSDTVLATTSDWSGPKFEWPGLFNQLTHGSIQKILPDKVFAFTSVSQAEDVPELTALSTLYGAFIIGKRMKAVLDKFSLPNSELFPVSMVLRDVDVRNESSNGDLNRMGGGDVIQGSHWLWHTYNRQDLVDWSASDNEPFWVEQHRDDVPGSPLQKFSFVNNKKQIALNVIDYELNPVFQILGSSKVFLSPDFTREILDADLVAKGQGARYATVMLQPYFLNRPRLTKCQIALRSKTIDSMPQLRVFGTEFCNEYGTAPFTLNFFSQGSN